MKESIEQTIQEIKSASHDMTLIMLITELVDMESKHDRAELADYIIDLFNQEEQVWLPET